MSQSTVKKVKNCWHRARNFHKKKNAEGVVTKSSTPGPTLKSWAKNQIETSGPHAEECKQWLKNKKTLAQQSRKAK
jgi:predicted ATP-grasp superfamily ATP-dependent carboligase